MYTLGIPNRQYRRATQVLGPELSDPIPHESHKQDDGFYMFSFPDVDEYEFKDIVLLLKNNGVTTIGADDTLTERNIMKLTDLLKEQGSNPEESNLFDELTLWLEKVRSNEPASRYATGSIAGEKNERTNNYEQDIEEMLEAIDNPLTDPDDQEEEENERNFASDDARDFRPMQEQGLNRMNRDMTPEEEFLKDNPSPGTSSPMSSDNITKIKLKMSNIEDEVTIKTKPGTNLQDVTISWGSESHTVDFEAGDIIDDHGNEGMDIETSADSDDGRWQFILDVQAEATFPMTGDFADWDWEELIIQDHPENEDHLDPEDRSDYEDEEVAASIAAAQDDINSMEEGNGNQPGLDPSIDPNDGKQLKERLQKLAGLIK
tara:strand:+ start:385 stop:1509 length:1125 start_codon:yes stop_codon:yes gene_type:complete